MVALEIFRMKISLMNQLEIASVDSLIDFVSDLSLPRNKICLRLGSSGRKKSERRLFLTLERFLSHVWIPEIQPLSFS